MAGRVITSEGTFTVCFPHGDGGAEMPIVSFAEAAQAEQALGLLRLHSALRTGDEAAASLQAGLQVCTGAAPGARKTCWACCCRRRRRRRQCLPPAVKRAPLDAAATCAGQRC